MHHFTIDIFCPIWWKGIVTSLFFISIPLLVAKKMSQPNRETLAKLIGTPLVFIAIFFHVYSIYIGVWDLQTSLPLQLCSMSGILSGLVIFWRKQVLFELLLYWGIPGGIHALLTPEVSNGNGAFFLFEYYLVHAGIILSPLFLVCFLDMKPRKNSWFNIFLVSQVFLVSVALVNYMVGGNYMYLSEKPSVNNPLLLGEWPWYILDFEIIGLLHFFIVYKIFDWFKLIKQEGAV